MDYSQIYLAFVYSKQTLLNTAKLNSLILQYSVNSAKFVLLMHLTILPFQKVLFCVAFSKYIYAQPLNPAHPPSINRFTA